MSSSRQIQVATWNIAAINNNPFEYWITYKEEPSYEKLMVNVSASDESFLVLLALGFGFGRYAESRHYRSIADRERLLARIPTVSGDTPGVPIGAVNRIQLVSGNVVISVDYFKRVVAGLRTLFGGTVQSYESLVDRARREAVLRLKEQCPGATQIINLRIETSSIHKGRGNSIGSVEVLAYGTAVYSEAA